MTDSESEIPRSASATSSLDPYYFGTQSREASPSISGVGTAKPRTTPETRQVRDPVTPGRDPAGIDRKGLIGVGELATPRWGRAPRNEPDDEENMEEEVDEGNELIADDDEEKDGPDSPWTIEAVNSESDERDEVSGHLF